MKQTPKLCTALLTTLLTLTSVACSQTTLDITDKPHLENGQRQYNQNCAACHGKNGEGAVGTNLVNNQNLKHTTLTEQTEIITNGTPKMPGYKNTLTEQQIQDIIEYTEHLKTIQTP